MDALRNHNLYYRAVKEEIKVEVMDCGSGEVHSEDVHQLCTACLCAIHTTHTLDDVTLRQYYMNIVTEAQLEASEPVLQPPRLCWECVADLKRSVRFREQVKDSYRFLQPLLLVYEEEDLTEFMQTSVCRPGRLRTCFAHSINISPQDGDAQTMTAEQHDDDDVDGDRTDDNNCLAARPPPQSYRGEGRGRGRASEPAQGAGAGPGTSRAQTKRTSSGDQLSPLSRETSRGPHKRACRSAPNAIVQPVISHAQLHRRRNWHLIMLVVPQDGRDLTDEQYRLLCLEVEKRHEETVDDLTQDFVPEFDHKPRPLPEGGLKFSCLDLATVSWLQEVTLKLPPLWEGGCKFMAVSWKELPKLVKGLVWLYDNGPPAHGTDIEGIRARLVRANLQRGPDMSRWRLLLGEFRTTDEGVTGALMLFGIPEADLPELEARQMKLCYKCGTVEVHTRHPREADARAASTANRGERA